MRGKGHPIINFSRFMQESVHHLFNYRHRAQSVHSLEINLLGLLPNCRGIKMYESKKTLLYVHVHTLQFIIQSCQIENICPTVNTSYTFRDKVN